MARYNKYHRGAWQQDRFADAILFAEENLKQAERMLQHIENERNGMYETKRS